MRCSAETRGTAVSLTPVALETDSRAFQIACTLADAGFRSIVVEGRRSRQRFWDDRLEVRSLEHAETTLVPVQVFGPGGCATP